MNALIAVLVVLLVALVVLVVSAPLRRGRHAGRASESGGDRDRAEGGGASHAAGAAGEVEAELAAAREAKYHEIRDAELDYRTGKLSQADYEAIDGQLRSEALEILDRIDAADGGRQEHA